MKRANSFNGRKIKIKIRNSQSLDEAILISQLTQNIPLNRIKSARKRLNVDEILIADYMSSNNSFYEDMNGKDFALQFSSFYEKFSREENMQDRTKISSFPLSKMAAIALHSRLEYETPKRLLSMAETREDQMQIVFINYLLSRLSDKRKEKVEEVERDIPSSAEKTASLYMMQCLEEPSRKLNSKMLSLIKEINKGTISITDLKRKEEILRYILPKADRETDEELFELQEERERYISELESIVERKIDERRKVFESDENEARNLYEEVNKKDLPTDEDILRLSSIIPNLNNASKFLEISGVKITRDRINKTLNDIGSLTEDYKEWKDNIKQLKMCHELVRKKRELFGKHFRKNKYRKSRQFIEEVEVIADKGRFYSSNKYLSNEAERIAADVEKFYQESKEMVNREIELYSRLLHRIDRSEQKIFSWPTKLIKKLHVEKRLSKIQPLKDSL